ncbi:S41 family peptidase [Psychrobacillus sp. L3]|uniref:S41 family peptidase n=1 Tax=Psychrobacillus sp. L3 TaxID=3236891 RepID=UPI0036F1D355
MEQVFKEVMHIMNRDYAGYKDKKGVNITVDFLNKIEQLKGSNLLTREKFVGIVKDYLLYFNDQHIYFLDQAESTINNKAVDRGFRLRRYKDYLFVTQVNNENRLKEGMFFKSVGGYTIPELKEKHLQLLNENHAEREQWMPILGLYDYGEIEDVEGNTSVFSFKWYEKAKYIPTYSIGKIDDKTLLLTISGFMNPDAIVTLIEENQVLLDTTENWIIDVRINYGGSDSSFHPLFPYLMPIEGVELADPEEKMLFNCTKANTDRALEDLNSGLDNIQDEQAKQFLHVFKREWEKNKGKGFVEFDFTELFTDTFIKGSNSPMRIVVLSDYMCGSSGDSFVEVCKKSSKVVVVGRPTMGLNDYANLVTKKWTEGFELMYPTSRLSRIDKGLGMTGKGIEPNIYIPWTPKHIDFDIDLEKALDYLSAETN